MKPFVFVLVVFALLSTNYISYGAFPMQMEAPAVPPAAEAHVSFKEKVKWAVNKYTHPAQVEKKSSASGGWLGIAALTLGIGAAMFFAAAIVAPTLGFMATFGFFSAVLAIIFGAIGLRYPNSGLARAGMILGIVEVGLLLLFTVLAIVLLVSYLK